MDFATKEVKELVLNKGKVQAEKGRLQQGEESTNKQIDNLVYELYGLALDETAIVKGLVK